MALCVVAIHTGPLYDFDTNIQNFGYNQVLALAVPYFFLAAGFLLGEKSLGDETIFLEVLRKYRNKLIKIYLIWSAVYIPLAVHGFKLGGYTLNRGFKSYVLNLVFTGEHYNSWPLWYLLSLIYAVQLYMMLRMKISDKQTEKCLVIAILIGVVSFGLNDFSKYNDYANFLERELSGILDASIKNGRLLSGCFFLPIGLFISENKEKYSVRKGTIMFIVFSIITYCTDNSFIRSFATAFSACGLFIVSMNLNLRPLPIWGILRKCSLTVYLLHMYVFTVIYMVLYGEKKSGVIPFVLTTLISVLIALMSLKIEKYKNKIFMKVKED